MTGNIECVRLLLAAGARVNYKNRDSVLNYVIERKRYDIFILLLKSGAKINRYSVSSGLFAKCGTPLSRAIQYDCVDMVITMLEYGADPTVTTFDGIKLINLAKSPLMIFVLRSEIAWKKRRHPIMAIYL